MSPTFNLTCGVDGRTTIPGSGGNEESYISTKERKRVLSEDLCNWQTCRGHSVSPTFNLTCGVDGRTRRSLVSADRGPQARLLSGRNFVDSSIPGGPAESTRGGLGVWRSVLAVANCFANGRECLTEQVFSSPLVWILGVGVVRPETYTPHCV